MRKMTEQMEVHILCFNDRPLFVFWTKQHAEDHIDRNKLDEDDYSIRPVNTECVANLFDVLVEGGMKFDTNDTIASPRS